MIHFAIAITMLGLFVFLGFVVWQDEKTERERMRTMENRGEKEVDPCDEY